MHPSLQRLLEAAIQASAQMPVGKRVLTLSDLRAQMEASHQTMNNWQERGVSKDGALQAEAMYGCSPSWVLFGSPPAPRLGYPSSGGLFTSPVAQEPSHPTFTFAPVHIDWEQLMSTPLGSEFQTVMPDHSMAPDVPRGAQVIFVTGVLPQAGDFVLVADSQGTPYVREYKELRPGHWQAHARNSAFLPLDSERDGLRVLAVFDGVRGRRAGG